MYHAAVFLVFLSCQLTLLPKLQLSCEDHLENDGANPLPFPHGVKRLIVFVLRD